MRTRKVSGENVKKTEDNADKTKIQNEINQLWTEAGQFYSSREYSKAANMWQEIYNKYKIKSRPFFNNWGSSLLNWARGLDKKDPKRQELLQKAIEKYKRAESFTRGVAAFNIACAYALLGDDEQCKDWLYLARDIGRISSRKRVEVEEDLESMYKKEWWGEFIESLDR